MKWFVAICFTVLLVVSVSAQGEGQGFNIPAGYGPGSTRFQQRIAKFSQPGGLLDQWSAPGGLFDQWRGAGGPFRKMASRNWRQYLQGRTEGAPAY